MNLKDKYPVSITMDVDWAPDFALIYACNLLKKNGIPATIFATHPSPALEEIKKDKNFEIGIHPNFFTNSSHGNNFTEIMDYMMNVVPEAECMRTHCLFQSSKIFFDIFENYKSIKKDFSTLVYHNCAITPYNFIKRKEGAIMKIPYHWDDYASFSDMSNDLELIDLKIPKKATYQVFNFHPIHIFLNTCSIKIYNQFKKHNNKRLIDLKKKNAEKYVDDESYGARKKLFKLIDNINPERFVLASRLPLEILEKK